MANSSSSFVQRWTPMVVWGIGIATVIGLLLIANELGYLGGKPYDYFESIEKLSLRVDRLMDEGKAEKALSEIAQSIPNSPGKSELLAMRGATLFRMGSFDESVSEFDKCIAHEPQIRPFLWQRGVSLFYAKKYDEAKKQFEAFFEVSPNNVETTFWHFMCNAELNGIEIARQELRAAEDDPRTPMMTIQKLIQGTGKPDEVLESIEKAGLPPERYRIALFNGYLYSGLYYGMLDDKSSAKSMLNKCVNLKVSGYMSDLVKHHITYLDL